MLLVQLQIKKKEILFLDLPFWIDDQILVKELELEQGGFKFVKVPLPCHGPKTENENLEEYEYDDVLQVSLQCQCRVT